MLSCATLAITEKNLFNQPESRDGANYRLTDEKTAFTKTPQVLASTIVDLLWDDAAEAERICAAHKPELTKAEYLEYMRSFA